MRSACAIIGSMPADTSTSNSYRQVYAGAVCQVGDGVVVHPRVQEALEEIEMHADRLQALRTAARDADRIRSPMARREAAGLEIGSGTENMESDTGRIPDICITVRNPV